PTTMRSSDMTFTAIWAPDASNSYQVAYYQQNLNDEGYTLVETVNGSDTVGTMDGTTVTAIPKEFTGFTYDSSNANNVKTGTIIADGMLTLKLYYTRNSYSLTFDTMGGTGDSITEVKYGAPIIPPTNVEPPIDI